MKHTVIQEVTQMAEEKNGQTGFAPEYVKELRQEAAEWRTKYRGLEQRVVQAEVRSELKDRNVKADPSWVKVAEGQSVTEAVEAFVTQYPHLMSGPSEEVEVEAPRAPKRVTKPLPGEAKNSNIPGPKAGGILGSKNLAEIKKDGKARGQMRDLYRELINKSNNNQSE
jgi:hypothetical protein